MQQRIWMADEVIKAAGCSPPPGSAFVWSHGQCNFFRCCWVVRAEHNLCHAHLDFLLLPKLWQAFVPVPAVHPSAFHSRHLQCITWLFGLQSCDKGAAATTVDGGTAAESAANEECPAPCAEIHPQLLLLQLEFHCHPRGVPLYLLLVSWQAHKIYNMLLACGIWQEDVHWAAYLSESYTKSKNSTQGSCLFFLHSYATLHRLKLHFLVSYMNFRSVTSKSHVCEHCICIWFPASECLRSIGCFCCSLLLLFKQEYAGSCVSSSTAGSVCRQPSSCRPCSLHANACLCGLRQL